MFHGLKKLVGWLFIQPFFTQRTTRVRYPYSGCGNRFIQNNNLCRFSAVFTFGKTPGRNPFLLNLFFLFLLVYHFRLREKNNKKPYFKQRTFIKKHRPFKGGENLIFYKRYKRRKFCHLDFFSQQSDFRKRIPNKSAED